MGIPVKLMNWPRKYARAGDRVRITADIFHLRHRKNRNGRVIRRNGGYIYVRPMWCSWEVELYDNELQVLP